MTDGLRPQGDRTDGANSLRAAAGRVSPYATARDAAPANPNFSANNSAAIGRPNR